jgi:hypothetical protein
MTMANDYSGLVAGISAFLTALETDKGIHYQNAAFAEHDRQVAALLRACLAAQGVTV